MNIYDDINYASSIIESKKDKNRLILSERDDINKYIESLKGKALLYDPSFDISLSSIQKGINDITIIDNNILSKYYLYLKQAGITTFNYQTYIEYFFYADWMKKVPFDESLYNLLRDNLYKINTKAVSFWDFMYDNYGYNFIKVSPYKAKEYNNLKYRLFRKDKIKSVNNITYLKNEDSYNKLKENINKVKINYISGNILRYNFKDSFDSIVISKELKLKKADNKLFRYLNKNGLLVYTNKNNENKTLIYKK